MIVTAIKTTKITSRSIDLLALLDQSLPDLHEGSIVAITSKIVSLCEGNTVPADSTDKETLIAQEADLYLPVTASRYGYHFSITRNTLASSAGIDESNGEGHYVLWPKDPQTTANQVRAYLAKRFELRHVGVVITDSISRPLRLGSGGIALAHSGFAALHDYRSRPDLFGRPFKFERLDIAGGLAAAATLQMGEGSEQTPLAAISDLPFVTFQDRDPTEAELQELHVSLEDDLYAPFLTTAPWQTGKKSAQ